MKRLFLISILTAAAGLAQTVPISVPGTGEPSINAIFSTAAVQQLAAQVSTTAASGVWPNSASVVPQSTTLTAGIASATATTASLASTTGIAVCNGLLIGAEVALVTGVNPLVLQRGMVGTAAATYASGTPVTVLRSGSYTCALKAMWFDQMASIMTTKLSASATAQSSAALVAQQAAIAALAAGAVQ